MHRLPEAGVANDWQTHLEYLESQILKLGLDCPHAQPVGEGNKHVQRLLQHTP